MASEDGTLIDCSSGVDRAVVPSVLRENCLDLGDVALLVLIPTHVDLDQLLQKGGIVSLDVLVSFQLPELKVLLHVEVSGLHDIDGVSLSHLALDDAVVAAKLALEVADLLKAFHVFG